MNNILFLMGGLEISDGVMTTFFVKHNMAEEANILVKPLLDDGSFLPLKIAGAILCIIALKLLHGRFPLASKLTASAITVFYTLVVTANISFLA